MGFRDHGGSASKPRASYTEVLRLMILLDKFWGVNIVFRFPSVLSIRVSFPVYSVLFLSFATVKPHPDNCLDFPFGLSFDNVRVAPSSSVRVLLFLGTEKDTRRGRRCGFSKRVAIGVDTPHDLRRQ